MKIIKNMLILWISKISKKKNKKKFKLWKKKCHLRSNNNDIMKTKSIFLKLN